MSIYMLFVSVVVIFAEVMAFPVSNGVGDVLVVGDDVPTCGVTAVDGIVPISGRVGLFGPVWAKGTVTIIGRSRRPRRYLPTYIPMISVESIPTSMAVAEEANKIGCGRLSLEGEPPVRGVTEVEGVLPLVGDVSFGGFVRAKGEVTISGLCRY